jgi:hypothetical protein
MAERKYYDRYSEFKYNGGVKILPFLKLPTKGTDLTVEYNSNTRLDIISQESYNNPNFGWLILQANPQFGSIEFNIPSGTIIRVPYPLQESLTDYDKAVVRYRKLYGI